MEIVLNFFYAFGLGVVFILGAAVGAAMLGRRIRKQEAGFNDRIIGYHESAERRLMMMTNSNQQMAEALERLATAAEA